MIKLDLNPPTNQLRQFGWISLIGFPLIGVMLTQVVASLPLTVLWVCLAIGALMGLAALAKAYVVIKPVYVGLMVVSYPIGIVIATVLLGLIYFGMFTPVGLVFRLTGRDLLHRKPDPAAKSYWRVRATQRTPASYLRLY